MKLLKYSTWSLSGSWGSLGKKIGQVVLLRAPLKLFLCVFKVLELVSVCEL